MNLTSRKPITENHLASRGARGRGCAAGLILLWVCLERLALGAETPAAAASELSSIDIGGSVLRLVGAFVFVIALFLAGVWVYRNLGRLTAKNGAAPRLSVLEARSLGNRHAIYVVAYEQQRLMVSSSPAGVTLITHLPDADASEKIIPVESNRFSAVFQQLVAGRR